MAHCGILITYYYVLALLAITKCTIPPSNRSQTAKMGKSISSTAPEFFKEQRAHQLKYGHYTTTKKALQQIQLEDKELRTIEDRWNSLVNASNKNSTLNVIPKNWLLPTKQDNVTFDSRQLPVHLAAKLKGLIEKYQPKKYSKHQQKSLHVQYSKNLSSPDQKVSVDMKNLTKKDDGTGEKPSPTKENNVEVKSNAVIKEYPGSNQTARNQLFEQWKKYYECLQNHTDFKLQAHYALQGGSIKMICEACLPPGNDKEIQWIVATERTNYMQEDLVSSEQKSAFSSRNHIAVRDKGLSLYIYGVNERDAGNYFCKLFHTILSVHLLQVADAAESVSKVWPESSPQKPHAAPEITLPTLGVTVFTRWMNWTSCSRCARVGKRFRVGICTVKVSNITAKNVAKILHKFRDGIPCRSKLLPLVIQTHPNVASRRSEIIEAFCKEPCPTTGKYVVRNEKGIIVEEADNAKGIYSMQQKLPHLPPLVQRKILFLKQWDTAYLQCPGNLMSDAPVRWFIYNQPIYSKGNRIYVTPAHVLVVEDLGLSDSKLYSCWQGSRLVGTVRLQVTQPIRISFSQQISIVSMFLIVFTLIIILLRALCNSLRHHT